MLRNLFRLGLFDDPFVDADRAGEIAGRADFVEAGKRAQRKSVVLLKAGKDGETTLPLAAGVRLYVEDIDPERAAEYGEVVETLEEADVALLRLQTPYEPRDGDFLEAMFHQGDLDFKAPERGRILEILKAKPTIVAINLDRPAVIPEMAAEVAGLLGLFGVNDDILLEAVFGRFNPTGKLPFELPEDVPYDSDDPLFPFGYGLTYEEPAEEAAAGEPVI